MCFEQFLEDTAVFLKWVEDHYPGIPVFYLGHSVGALIGTHFGLRIDDFPNRGFRSNSQFVVKCVLMIG